MNPFSPLSMTPFSMSRRTFVGMAASVAGARFLCAEPSPAKSKAPKLKRGMNLHHLLNWPDTVPDRVPVEYVWPPFATPGYQISDEELKNLAEMGFDFLRITVDPSIFIATRGGRKKELLSLARQRVERLIGSGFSVIFDLHPVNVNPAYGPLKLVESIEGPEFKAYADLVEDIAREFASLPHDKVIFELMNEPWLYSEAGRASWPPMLLRLHERARKGSADLPLILTGAVWGSMSALMELDLKPFAKSNVFYTFHCYDPHTFTHQGVEGDEGEYLSQLRWKVGRDNLDQVRRDAFATIDNLTKSASEKESIKKITDKLLTDYELTAHDPERLRADFGKLAEWAKAHGIEPGRVLLGEFGCVAYDHKKQLLGEDRGTWLKAVRDAAETNGFPWAFWAYKGYGGMGLFDDKGKGDPVVLRALGL